MYRIKPLEWEKAENKWSDVKEKYEACTAISYFSITQDIDGDWGYSYCFREYYDEGMGFCKDLEDGKAICGKLWEDKLKQCLIEVEKES